MTGTFLPGAASAKVGPAGFSPEGLRAVTAAMSAAVDKGDVPGVVTLLYRHGLVAQVNALGFRDEASKTPMRRDTIFRIASMTKPIIAVAVLMLIEDGTLSLDMPAEKFLPELADRKLLRGPGDPLDSATPSPRGITVIDLLTHRSGIVTPDSAPGPATEAIKQADARRDEGYDAWMKRVGALPLVYEPGTHFNYGNSFDVLGILLARASGMSLPDFLRTRIFKPLGMKDTGFMVPAGKMGRFATNYAIDPATKQRVVADRADETSRWAKMPAFPSGGGGLVSTADDYLLFARMLLGNGRLGDARFLSHESLALMTANELPPDQRKIPFAGFEFWAGQGFGLGVSVVDDAARQARSPFGYSSEGSFGWPGAFGTWWQVDPKEDMIQIFLIQQPAGDPRSPLLRFKEASYRAIND
ncbi:MAG TPA: serine hydrolase domain-containing protein [Alphaproteobacteria bacterium]|nr:serine hydrolase domain-containing protein [Alphaproteobacteria bacterium]